MLRDELAKARAAAGKSAFCFPGASDMYRNDPDRITLRVKQVLALAFDRAAVRIEAIPRLRRLAGVHQERDVPVSVRVIMIVRAPSARGIPMASTQEPTNPTRALERSGKSLPRM
jgi:hypothetical protein